MRVIKKSTLKLFIEKYPRAAEPLLRWYLISKAAEWRDFVGLKKDFPSADYVGNDLYVFNIGGNKYRVIARIFFKAQVVYIRFVGTHAEYDQVNLSDL